MSSHNLKPTIDYIAPKTMGKTTVRLLCNGRPLRLLLLSGDFEQDAHILKHDSIGTREYSLGTCLKRPYTIVYHRPQIQFEAQIATPANPYNQRALETAVYELIGIPIKFGTLRLIGIKYNTDSTIDLSLTPVNAEAKAPVEVK